MRDRFFYEDLIFIVTSRVKSIENLKLCFQTEDIGFMGILNRFEPFTVKLRTKIRNLTFLIRLKMRKSLKTFLSNLSENCEEPPTHFLLKI